MKIFYICTVLLIAFGKVYAQQPATPPPPPLPAKHADPDAPIIIEAPGDTSKTVPYDPSRIFTLVEVVPSFPGGMDKFYQYLGNTIRYPANAEKNRTQGKVFVTFIIEKDGSLSDVKLFRGVSADIDAEALRVVKNSPKWIPGMQGGKPVRVQYFLPINFSLSAK